MQSRKIFQNCWFTLLCSAAAIAHAETVQLSVQKLSQAEYNQKIQQYTDQVNLSKTILDAEGSSATAQEQTQAFCTRLNAYRQILKISQENATLEMANLMQFAAQHYLQQQQESLQSSGLNESAFCSTDSK
ncbi:hypothetical protein B9T33_11390 [Acinetobacter sp. ANC 5054]|uniref:hypothetical protein n=1 Tax=Acinetobacter sp. ANC 5054 TaxID=1977877 RepID=UPI000B756EC7|nr:hypothetical protein [Acinetobacter sp. ANC 5054]OTG79734.1 hypothetical protein B9T33_11390 [Acinetobacter sp. ANC 5054]